MNISPHSRVAQNPTSLSRQKFSARGFALIATLSVMSLLMMIAMGMLSLASVSIRKADHEIPRAEAMANARLALTIALAQLQESSGHDQRITATADSIMDPNAAASTHSARKNWVGVWDSSTYNPNPNNPDNDKSTHFLKWLVSSSDQTALYQADPTQLSLSNPLTIFDGNGFTDSVEVDKIEIKGDDGRTQGSYAYWIKDNGVKASTVWSLNETGTDDEQQASRLMVAAGPDITSFASAGSPVNATNIDTYYQDIDKLSSVEDLYLSFGTTHSYSWVKENYHDLTVFSQAVLSDTKLGGLQRDLSLAFEMDGDAEAESADKFNSQEGEFVAGGDRLEEGEQSPGMPVKARHPYRDISSSGSPFSADIARSDSVLRGPTWWALRDYANLYKQLAGNSGNHALAARSYYPNSVPGNDSFYNLSSTLTPFVGRSLWDSEIELGGAPGSFQRRYIYRPAKSTYAPSFIGSSMLVGLSATPANTLEITVDFLVFLWNPYNCQIDCPNGVVLALGAELPNAVSIWKDSPGSTPSEIRYRLSDLSLQNLTNKYTNSISYHIKGVGGGNLSLKPGEIVVASTSGIDGELNIGYDGWDIDSGLRLDTGLPLDQDDKIYYNLITNAAVGGRNEWGLHLPDHGTLVDLTQADTFGPQSQYIGFPFNGSLGSNDFKELKQFDPSLGYNSGNGVYTTLDQLKGSKLTFGLQSLMMKPAYWDGPGANPVEVFSRFNPVPTIVKREFNRVCGPNQLFHIVSGTDINQIFSEHGIDFSARPDGRAHWGLNSRSTSTERFPMIHIPRSPLLSVAALSHANISLSANEPFRVIGNSWSSPYIPTSSVYGSVHDEGNYIQRTAHDLSWHMNDALFDRYFFSGFSGESPNEIISSFYDGSHGDAEASPILKPYIPSDSTPNTVYKTLNIDDNNDGYKKTSAYALIDGAFNINSTSVNAWEALLKSNKDMAIKFAEGEEDTSDGTPYPSGNFPVNVNDGAIEHWAGFARLTDDQIKELASNIVKKIKERGSRNGPFMSLSDFINRPMGLHQGLLQEAIDETRINEEVRDSLGSLLPVYESTPMSHFQHDQTINDLNGNQVIERSTAMGIPGEINQADLLLPIAPRLRPRSDTFTIRAYGESLDVNGKKLAEAYCEAVVQRIPEYVDSSLNDPWDDPSTSPHTFPKLKPELSTVLQGVNKALGRKYKTLSFRWLNPDEI
ncbi:hypothetical protein ACFPK9_11745 [Rubritalea spongiae]|uniref:Verru_Chthon cassette protein A n=1 Tax=Rubritalea spongiae TaxID=430797 RepID=A0ABW5DZ73_9BACT